MKNLLGWIIVLPYGVIMSGPFAIGGTIVGTIIGIVIGLLIGKFLL
jgi:uncharacterized membrane protein